ncbi:MULTISPECIES: ribonuclease J1 [Mesobacillus]|uniref:Ribonuclease J n=2 Tax=Mesobacillus TaxID=2675231 RepID=A0A0D6ZCZ3_9BACI|nr:MULTISPECIES: ribonuclease J [Mesobacillus]KIY22448.1 ribonuclease J [Mesobacillus subterraneus]MDQ0414371.1 ribonuclease J [Mesobacillus stamsii]
MEKKVKKDLKIFALGGLGEIGKNTYVIEYKNEMVLVDCGIKFPDNELFGIDYVLADYTYLKQNQDKLVGIFVTHGHEDHIGGLPFLLQDVKAPIYGGDFAIELIKSKLLEHKIKGVQFHQINNDTVVEFQNIKVRFFRTTHSIADSFGVAVTTPEGNIVHTGDFKFDLTPVGKGTDFQKIAEISGEGVLCLLSDSTNSEKPGFSVSEQRVGEAIEDIFQTVDGRVIFATFASNIDRVQQVVQSSLRYKRKIAIVGRSMEKTFEIGRRLGYITAPDEAFVSVNEINHIPSSQLTIICTGSQGEPMAALARIANGTHRQIAVIPGDTIVFSSSPIPGNTVSVNRVIDKLHRIGADVIHHKISEVHTSGHGKQEEQKLMIKLLNPKFFIPIHGEYRMLDQHVRLAMQCGIPRENSFILDNGDVLELSSEGGEVTGKVPAQPVYVDGNGIGDIGQIVLKDRRVLSQDGLVIVTMTIDREKKQLINKPSVVTRGFVYVRESGDLMKNVEELITDKMVTELAGGTRDWSSIKKAVIDVVHPFLYSKTGRRPMILPIIMEV